MNHVVTFPSRKYVYDLRSQSFKEYDTMIRVDLRKKQFNSGGMRVCFEVEEVEEDGSGIANIAKFFKKNIDRVVEVDYMNEAMAQCMCEDFANNFNKNDTPRKVSFLACHVVRILKEHVPQELLRYPIFSFRTEDTDAIMFVMEHKLNGYFTKYNSNYGEVYEKATGNATESVNNRHRRVLDTAEAFSHFTLQETDGSMLVCDIQGVEDLFTDPQIHTEEGKGLGMGNMGEDGIAKWVVKHQCNDICKRIGLNPLMASRAPPPPAQVVPVPPSQPIPQSNDAAENRYLAMFNSMHASVREDPQSLQAPQASAMAYQQQLDHRYGQGPPQQLTRADVGRMSEDEQLEYALRQSEMYR
jgi:myosin-heavy-chain kinase